MRVLNVAFSEIPIGPSGGGAEQIVSILDAGLVARGHRSIVVAAPGSAVAGELIESVRHDRAIESLLEKETIDLIHFHGLDFWRYLPVADVPMAATLHLPIEWYPEQALRDCRARGVFLNCVSRSQADSSPVSRDLPVIANGIPTELYRLSEPGDYFLWLGRICPEKAPHIALEAARRLDIRLMVAGPVHVYPEHQSYFARCVKPLLDEMRTYAGPADRELKQFLLSRARCLLITSLVAETSSLVAMESLSSGNPVVAFRRGALPEIIDEGETGFLVDTSDEMCAAILRIEELSRRACRKKALARFDSHRMVDEYLAVYREMTTRHFSIG